MFPEIFLQLRICQEREQKEAEEREQRRAEGASRLPEEPEKGASGVAEILVRLPDGQRASRRFPGWCEVSLLFDWLDSRPPSDDFDAAKMKYHLSTSFPIKSYSRKDSSTLEEAGLCPQAVLFLRIDD
jgi:FAS-associated factor 2